MLEVVGIDTCSRANNEGYYIDPSTQSCLEGHACIWCVGDNTIGWKLVQATGNDPRVTEPLPIYCGGLRFLGVCTWDPEFEKYDCLNLELFGLCTGQIYQADYQTSG